MHNTDFFSSFDWANCSRASVRRNNSANTLNSRWEKLRKKTNPVEKCSRSCQLGHTRTSHRTHTHTRARSQRKLQATAEAFNWTICVWYELSSNVHTCIYLWYNTWCIHPCACAELTLQYIRTYSAYSRALYYSLFMKKRCALSTSHTRHAHMIRQPNLQYTHTNSISRYCMIDCGRFLLLAFGRNWRAITYRWSPPVLSFLHCCCWIKTAEIFEKSNLL